MNAAVRRVAIFAVLAIVALQVSCSRVFDGPPPDDADLMTEPARPADHENAFLTLTAAAALLRWPGDESEAAHLREMARGKSWDDALAAAALAANERALTAFARASRQTAFRSPDRKARPDLIAWRNLAWLTGVRAVSLAQRGDADAAIGAAISCLRVGKALGADSNGSGLNGALAAAIGIGGLEALRAVFEIAEIPRARGLEIASELATLRSDPEAWRGLLSAEYREFAPAMARVPFPPLSDEPAPWLLALLPDPYRYQPNNTRAAYADAIRALQAVSDQPCLEAIPDRLHEPRMPRWFEPNSQGRLFLGIVAPYPDLHLAHCRFDTSIEALRAALGVQAFERDRGVLPPSLEALVPTYLPSAPRDWFGDGPLRLDRAARAVVSVGFWNGTYAAARREERFSLLPAPRGS